MPAAEWEGVTKRYPGRTALSGLSLVLERGRTLGLLGPNGAGKTTSLRLLLGFCRPTSGRVRLAGEDPARPEARRGLGYLPEQLVVPGHMTVGRFLRLHARLAGLSGAAAEAAIHEVATLTGIADRAGDRMGGLSKGLRQRVGFAQAFLGDPSLLLLDEPTSGLDPIGVRDARQWIQRAQSRGATVLVSSHVLSEVERTCDEVAILHEGRLVASGPIGAVVREGESLEDAFVRQVGA